MIDPKGHQADSPWQMPLAAWKDIAVRTYHRTWDDNVGLVAAGVAFYGFFALLSLLGLIVLSYGFVTDPHSVVDHFGALTRILPSDVAYVISQQLMTSVAASEGVKGLGILLAASVAIYGGTNGAAAILTALNIAYEEKEKRSLWRFYRQAVAMTLTALTIALLAIGLAAGMALIRKSLPVASAPLAIAGRIGAYVVLVAVTSAVAATLYRFGPSREKAKWRWITPGSLFAGIVWVLATVLFGLYVATFTNYRASYGSFGAVVAMMTWLYLSAYAFLFGAELNSEIEHQTARDSTTGPPEELGDRGAWAADNVAFGDDVQDRPEEAREGERLTAAAPELADTKK